LLKSYRVPKIQGDRYGSSWPVEQFSKFGIIYEQAARPKNELYQAALALINSGRIELLDHQRLTNQLTSLERRTVRGGRDSIDHPPGGHDDVANAVCGVAATIISKSTYNLAALAGTTPDDDDPDGASAFRMLRLMQHIARYG
jgi:hypothetical protein